MEPQAKAPAASLGAGEGRLGRMNGSAGVRASFAFHSAGEEQRSVATAQAARGWARPPYSHFNNQSC